jgi:hypothetical protein
MEPESIATKAIPSQTRNKIDFGFCFRTFVIGFGLVFIYTYTRYVYYQGVESYHIPVFIFNKTIAVTGVVLICLAYAIGPLSKAWPTTFRTYITWRPSLGVMGFACMLIHTCWSLITLRPQIHAKFFDEKGALSASAEWAFFFGTIAMVHLTLLAIISIPVIAHSMEAKQWKRILESGLIALLFGLGHLFFMGYRGWYPVEKWQSPLPPTTLVAASIIVLLFAGRLTVSLYGKGIRPWFQQRSKERTGE